MHLQPTNKEIAIEIEKLNDMILKYNSLEKDMFKKMFNGNKSTTTTTTTDSNNNDSFKPNGNSLNDETKEYITNKLNEFLNDKEKLVYKIQADYYPDQTINYITKSAEELGLSTRFIKGNTNILQIMKEA